MNRSDWLTDELIQAAFEQRARRADSDGLREDILTRTAATPQRRIWRLRLASVLSTPVLRPASIALLVALALLCAALAVAFVGQHPRTPLRTGSWTRAANMLQAREAFTATSLRDGSVLVAGGASSEPGPIVASCELYDPRTGTWRATGEMIEAREDFTATRLPDGTVLVAGGSNSTSSASLDSAELYDSGTGSWTGVGHMLEARAKFAATLLPHGMVLVVGGHKDTTPHGLLASAELYDPTSRSWTATGTMLEAREGLTATLLPNGKVLVAGGSIASNEATATAELYDPSSGSWTRTGAMIEARVAAAATLLPDGEVLVAGGHRGSGLHSDALASAELYDPDSGSWTATGSMIDPDAFMTATLLPDRRVLVAGGFESDAGAPQVELYDAGARAWSSAGTSLAPSTEPTATLMLDGKILIAGGSITGSPLDTTELFDPAGGT